MRRHSKQLLALFLALVCLLSLAPCLASAAESPINVTITLDRAVMTEPGSVNVTVRVSNTSDASKEVYLFDPANKPVSSFGDGGFMVIAVGETREWTGTWSVTREQLSAGSIAYTVRYKIVDETGALIDDAHPVVASIAYESERVELDVSRAVPEMTRVGSTLHVVYTLRNLGNVAIKDIAVKEHRDIAAASKTVDSLAPGASVDVDFSVKMGDKALTSSATITYKPENAKKNETKSVPKATIGVAKPALSFTVKADKESVQIGEDVTLTFTLNNQGNVIYRNVTITDPELGTVFQNQTINAGTAAKPTVLTLTHTVRMNKKYKFQFVMKGDDNTGSHPDMAANNGNPLVVNAIDPTQVMLLTLIATPERYTIESTPEDMRFTIEITNASTVDAEDIAIMHGSTHVYTIPELVAGQSMTLRRDFSLSQGGKYQFTAACKNQMGEKVTFVSEPVIIDYSAPVPNATLQPTPYIPAPTVVPAAEVPASTATVLTVLGNLAIVLGVVAGGLLVLVVVGVVFRGIRSRQSKNAMDHMDLGERRDYLNKENDSDQEKEPAFIPNEPAQEEQESFSMPHEKYLRPVDGQTAAPDEAPSPQDELTPPEDDALSGEYTEDSDAPYRSSVQLQSEASPDGADANAPYAAGDTGGYRLHRDDNTVAPTPEPRARARRRSDAHSSEGLDEE